MCIKKEKELLNVMEAVPNNETKRSISELREETYREVMANLAEQGKCAIVRPCSFGKTILSVRIAKEYGKVLFLCPTYNTKTTMENRYADSIKNIEFELYCNIARMTDDEISAMKHYDLVIADEMHHAGAAGAGANLKKLLAAMPCHLIGATATVERMDGIDVIEEFFDGICVSAYSLHDSIMDGIVKKPYYCYCSYGLISDIKAAIQELDVMTDGKTDVELRAEVERIIKKNVMEYANIFHVEKQIRNVCDKYVEDTSYMKFISFFNTVDALKKNMDMVVGWFKTAYPDHKIRVLEIHCKARGNLEKLEQLKRKKNTIDIVFSCDMLNEEYHVDNITGIVMCRNTYSSRIYIQQLGRILSSDENVGSKVVFDIVDNLHRKSIFKEGTSLKEQAEELADKKDEKEGKDNEKRLDRVEGLVYEKEARGKDKNGVGDGVYYYPTEKPWYLNANRVDKADVYAVGNEATYAEFIKKAVYEAIEKKVDEASAKYYSLGGKLHKSEEAWKSNKLDYQKIQAVARMFHLTTKALITAMGAKEGELAQVG